MNTFLRKLKKKWCVFGAEEVTRAFHVVAELGVLLTTGGRMHMLRNIRVMSNGPLNDVNYEPVVNDQLGQVWERDGVLYPHVKAR